MIGYAPWRRSAAWFGGLLLEEPRCAALSIAGPEPRSSTARAGLSGAAARLAGVTVTGRRFTFSVFADEAPVPGSLSDVPVWSVPGPYGDALADPDVRRWVALTVGGWIPQAAFVAPDHWIRRLTMARHLEAARFGVRVNIEDDVVMLDLALDLQRTPQRIVSLAAAFDAIEADALRPGEPALA